MSNLRNILFSKENQKKFLLAYFSAWLISALCSAEPSKFAFLGIIFILHVVIYGIWFKSLLRMFSVLVILILVFFRLSSFGIEFIFSILTLCILVFYFYVYIKEKFFNLVESYRKDIEIIERHWQKEFLTFSFFRETTYFLFSILALTHQIFGELLQENTFLIRLWSGLFFYCMISFIIFEFVTLIIINVCNPWTNFQILHSGKSLFSAGVATTGIGLGFHLVCTTPGVNPPVAIPGVTQYQETVLGYSARTGPELSLASLYSTTHKGALPPCIEGTKQFDIDKTSDILKVDMKEFFKDVASSSGKDGIDHVKKSMVKVLPPFVKNILPLFLDLPQDELPEETPQDEESGEKNFVPPARDEEKKILPVNPTSFEK